MKKERIVELFESIINHCCNAFNLQSIVFKLSSFKKSMYTKLLLINQFVIIGTNIFVLKGQKMIP